MPTEEPDDLFWATARRFRPVHGMAAAALACMILCCGPCMLLRSCSTSGNRASDTVAKSELSAEELSNLIADGATVSEEAETPPPPPAGSEPVTIDDFTYEQRIVAERMRVGEWNLVSDKTRLQTAQYIALSRHADDTEVEHSERVISYLMAAFHAAKIPAAREYLVEAVFIAADRNFDPRTDSPSRRKK